MVYLRKYDSTKVIKSDSKTNYLGSMLKPYWNGSQAQLDSFIDDIVKSAVVNNTGVNYVDNKNLLTIRNELANNNTQDAIKEIFAKDLGPDFFLLTLHELRDRFNSTVTFDTYINKDDVREVFFNKLSANALKNINETRFLTLEVDLSELSIEQKEAVKKEFLDYESQSLFTSLTFEENAIQYTHSTYGINKYNNTFSQAKPLLSTFGVENPHDKGKEAIRYNYNTYDFVKQLSEKFPDLTFSDNNKHGKSAGKVYGSNQILKTNEEAYEINKINNQAKINSLNKLKTVNAMNNRGSDGANQNINRTVDPEARKKEYESKKITLTDIISIKTDTINDIKDTFYDLKLKELKRELDEATKQSETIAAEIIKHLENGTKLERAIEIVGKNFSNPTSMELGLTLATKTLCSLKNTNNELVNENKALGNNYKDMTEKFDEFKDDVAKVLETKDENINTLELEVKKASEVIDDTKKILEERQEQLNKTIETLKETNQALDTTNGKLDLKIQEAEIKDNKITELSKLVEERNKTLEIARVKFAEQKLMIDTLKSENAELNQNNETLNMTNLNLKSEKEDAEKWANKLETQVENLNGEIINLNDTFKEEIKDKDIEVQTKDAEIKALESKLETLKTEYANMKIEKENEYTKILKERDNAISSKYSEIGKMENNYKSELKEKDDLIKTLKTKNDMLDTIQYKEADPMAKTRDDIFSEPRDKNELSPAERLMKLADDSEEDDYSDNHNNHNKKKQ